ncbi:hypothetical protein P9112_008117 [Eukaryota sp. TZLM1-RC]
MRFICKFKNPTIIGGKDHHPTTPSHQSKSSMSCKSPDKHRLVSKINCFSDNFKRFIQSSRRQETFVPDSIDFRPPPNSKPRSHSTTTNLNEEMLRRISDIRSHNNDRLSQLTDQYSQSSFRRSRLHELHRSLPNFPTSPQPSNDHSLTLQHTIKWTSRPSRSQVMETVASDASSIVSLSDEEQEREVWLEEEDESSIFEDSVDSAESLVISSSEPESSPKANDDYIIEEEPIIRERPKKVNIEPKSPRISRTLKEYLDQKEEELNRDTCFKARPVPKSTKRPKFRRIQEDRLRRSMEIKQKSKELTKAREAPFALTQRPKRAFSAPSPSNFPSIDVIPPHKPKFKAKPVPETCRIPLFDNIINNQDEERKARKKERSTKLLSMSKLPKRMEFHEELKKEGVGRKPTQSKFRFKPKINRKIPDFDELQLKFRSLLDSKKNEFQPTEPVEFNLSCAKNKESVIEMVKNDILKDEQMLSENRWPYMAPRTAIKPSKVPPESMPPPQRGTITSSSRAETTAKRREEKELRELELRKEEAERRRKHREITKKVAAAVVFTDEEYRKRNEQKCNEFKERVANDTAAYMARVREMYDQLETRPFLFQRSFDKTAKKSSRDSDRKSRKVKKRVNNDDSSDGLSDLEPTIVIEGDDLE